MCGVFLQAAKYTIGGSEYVLDDLENGILRGNRPAASSIGMLLKIPQLSKGPFTPSDPRAAHVSGLSQAAATSNWHDLLQI